jgi:hypothetical protein
VKNADAIKALDAQAQGEALIRKALVELKVGSGGGGGEAGAEERTWAECTSPYAAIHMEWP